ncbi:hypothetical protein JOB18_027529 [Solea senegalensis]|uniref:Uncharacterized protein n=1 Tax=Solea senegalensis TaxID=28829 RepID=A0AAV6RS77_SOLSE|nr:hypothetical protein JOB18_027529 [Solea senegalensis]
MEGIAVPVNSANCSREDHVTSAKLKIPAFVDKRNLRFHEQLHRLCRFIFKTFPVINHSDG